MSKNRNTLFGGGVVFFLLVTTASRVDGWLRWIEIGLAVVVFALCTRRLLRQLAAKR